MYRIQTGWTVFKRNLSFILKKPFLLLPMALAWGILVYGLYLVQGRVDFDTLPIQQVYLILFGFTFFTTFVVGIASLFILELLEQHETTGRMNPFKALFDMLTRDLWRALPIILFWAIIDFVLIIIISILNSSRKRKNGPSRPKGLLQRSVEAFRDLVRMGSMTVFTVIAWENLGPKASFDKGFMVFKSRFAEMLTGFGLGKIIGFLAGIPMIIAVIGLNSGVFPVEQTIIIIVIYISIIWSLGKLIEQLYVSELYLWYMHFEKARRESKRNGTTPPSSLEDVPMPSFTDNNFDLVEHY